MSRKGQALLLSLVVGTSLSLTALPSQADEPTPASGTTGKKIIYETYTFDSSSSFAASAKARMDASPNAAAPDAASNSDMKRISADMAKPSDPSTPEQETALAEASYDQGVTYEYSAEDLPNVPVSAENADSAVATSSADQAPSETSSGADTSAGADASASDGSDVPFAEDGTDAPTQPSSGRALKGDYDYIGFYECLDHNKQASSDLGWTKNHYAWCQNRSLWAQKVEDDNGVRTIKGTLTMNRMIRGSTTRENRTMKVRQNNYNVSTSGDFRDGVGIDSYISCTGYPSSAQCRMDGGAYAVLKTNKGQGINYTMKSDASGSDGKDKKGIGVFKPISNVYDSGQVASLVSPAQGVRCDSATYVAYKSACIFDRVEGTLTFNRSDSRVNEAAKHMYDALNNPSKTYPKFSGKTVPSRMHRMYYNKTQQTANHNAAVKVCKDEWGSNYTSGKKQCDEFPFKTTREGAAKGDRRFSARPILGTDNGNAGNDLGKFFTLDHILDGDAFHVKVK